MLIDRLKRIKTICDISLATDAIGYQEAVIRIDTIVGEILDARFLGDYAKIDEAHKPKVNQKQVEALKGEKP